MEEQVQVTNDQSEMSQAEIARAISIQAEAVYRKTSADAEKAMRGMTMGHWFDKLNLKRYL